MGIWSPILYPVSLERGGLGADVSAYNGIVYIANGAAGQVTIGQGVAFDPNTGELTGDLIVRRNGSLVGSQPTLNLIEGDGVAIVATDNVGQSRIDVTISCDCGDGTDLIANGQLIRPLVQPTGDVDGVNTDFLLPDVPVANSEHVYKNGILQLVTSEYTITGNVLTFVTPPVATPGNPDVILVDYWPSGGTAQSAQRITRETPGGAINSINTVFTTASNIHTETERVWLNGLLQLRDTDYTVTGAAQITFTDPPTTGDDIRISYWVDGALDPTLSVFNEVPAEVPDGVITNFTLSEQPASSSLHVYRNGILDQEGVDFQIIGGPEVQYNTAPLTGDELVFYYDTPGGIVTQLLNSRVMYETPAGLVDGLNVTYTLANDALLGYVEFYVEGEQLHYTAEFTQAGAGNRTLTLAVAPLVGNRIWAHYWRI